MMLANSNQWNGWLYKMAKNAKNAGNKGDGQQGTNKQHGQQGTRGQQGARGAKAAQGSKAKGTIKSPSQARLERRANDEKIIKTIRLVFVAIVALAVIGVSIGIFLYVYKPPVASVGGSPIRQYEFAYFMNMSRQYSVDGDEEQLRANALQEAADVKIHVAKAKEMGVELTDEDKQSINSMFDEMIPYYAEMMSTTPAAYIRDNFGVSQSEYRKLMDILMLNDRLSNYLADGVEVSDETAQATYDEAPGDYDEVTVRHVLFMYEGLDPDNPRTPEQSLALAEGVLLQIQSGEDIAALAEELTEDTGSASTGGEYTFTRNDAYVEEFKNWAFEAEVGDQGIVETEYGYHVMQLDAKRMEFEDFKDTIVSEIKWDAVADQFDAWREEPQYEVSINQSVYETFF